MPRDGWGEDGAAGTAEPRGAAGPNVTGGPWDHPPRTPPSRGLHAGAGGAGLLTRGGAARLPDAARVSGVVGGPGAAGVQPAALHGSSRLSQWRGRAGFAPASNYVTPLAPSVVRSTLARDGVGGNRLAPIATVHSCSLIAVFVRRLPPRLGCRVAAVVALAAAARATAAQPAHSQPAHPQPAHPQPARPAAVHGLYVPAAVAGSRPALDSLLDRLRGTSVNAVVLDVKENGVVPYRSRVPLARAVGAVRPVIADLPALLRAVRARGLYPIARIVCFRDPVLAGARPDRAILGRDGRPWLDPAYRQRWVDPYDARVWAYNVALAREAVASGFGEVQWDYVRFPDVPDSVRAGLVFPAAHGRSPAAAIDAFVAGSRLTLGRLGAPVTVDVFGRAITESGDSEGIGQDWDSLATTADAILPMIYPSHYRAGNFDLPDPNAAPYELVRRAMAAAVARTRSLPRARARIRPWLQAFTLGAPPYGGDEVRAQVRGAADAGVREWVLWNAAGEYSDDVLAGVARDRGGRGGP